MSRWMLLAALILAAPLSADEPPSPSKPWSTPEQGADAVVETLRTQGAEALSPLARSGRVDAWILAEVLVVRGESEAAEALARVAVDAERLLAYVRSRHGQSTDPGTLAACWRADAAFDRRDFQGMLQALTDLSGPAGSITAILVQRKRGWALHELGRWQEARAEHRASREHSEQIGWQWGSRSAFQAEGHAALAARDLDGARAAYGAARDLARTLGNRHEEALALVNLGNVEAEAEASDRFREACEQALSIFLELKDPPGVALASGNLGNALQILGRLDEAERLQRTSLRIYDDLGDRWNATRMALCVSRTLNLQGRHEDALLLSQQALAHYRRVGHRVGEADALVLIGGQQQSLGHLAEALETDQRAIAINQELPGFGPRAAIATLRGNIANIYTSMGELGKALSNHLLALKLKRELGLRGPVALTLANIAALQGERGEYAAALASFEEAERICAEIGDPQQLARIRGERAFLLYRMGLLEWSLEEGLGALATMGRGGAALMAHLARMNLAAALLGLERVEEARSRLLESLAGFRALKARAYESEALATLASSYSEDRPEEALRLYAEALAIQDGLGDRRHKARIRARMAMAHARLGQRAQARALLERALRELERAGSDVVLLRLVGDLAGLELESGEVQAARERAHGAVKRSEELLQGLGDESGLALRGSLAGLYAVGARAAARLGDADEVAFFLESGRAGSLLESLAGRDELALTGVPEQLARDENEASAREAEAAAKHQRALKGDDEAAIERSEAQLATARAASTEVRERIRREAKGAAALWYPTAATLEEIQQGLAADEALLLFAWTDEEVLALVVGHTEARIVTLGPPAPIQSALAALQLHDQASAPSEALSSLRNLVLEPLAVPSGTRRLLISPEGPLCYLPFAVLAPDRPVVHVPSGTVCTLLRGQRLERGRGVLALGDPDYQRPREKAAKALYGRGSRLKTLPFTRQEAEEVGQTVLLGDQATEAGLKAALAAKVGRWRSVHLACHGLVNPEQPMLSALALTPDAENDGYLTALDVMRLKIPADLAVLSACETATGKIVRGEGIVGLTRAFLFAGAPRVLCSLWPVDDAATRALMTAFYAAWNAGAPADQALRSAQAAVREKPEWAHPHYWAAWVLWGIPE